MMSTHVQGFARKVLPRVSSSSHLGGTRLASTGLRAAPHDSKASQKESTAASGVGFNFANIPVFSSAQTRALRSATRDGLIQPVGPARWEPRCTCGGTCPKCRNPQGLASASEIFTRDRAPESIAAELMTRNGDGDGGAGGDGGGAAGGGGGGVAAPPARSARLKSGPRYTPNGNLTPTVAGPTKSVPFVFDGVFDSDPAAGVFPGCGEIHQDIKWDAAAATSFTALTGNPVPHGGFPATHPARVWIEDRDAADTRYGRRSGPQSAPVAGADEYTNAGGVQDMAHGAIYHGSDNPTVPVALTGRWQFMVLAFDMCNHGVQVGSADFITIDW